MMLYNLKNRNEKVTFKEAVTRGIGTLGGLYFPESLPLFTNITQLLEQDFVTRSTTIIQKLLGDEYEHETLAKIVKRAFYFPIKQPQVESNIYALELFWGPTLAFKDFGARFMAQLLSVLVKEPITIVTATSGDTGAAVAHAFKDVPNIQVVILYPYQRISELQEKLFCTLGGNIHTVAVRSDFDACQALVKQCFTDETLPLRLNSANSINISRVLAQTLYYFEAVARLPNQEEIVVSVPSGNFGNLTAGLFAKAMGLPIKAFVAATNANDTVPRYLQSGNWDPRSTVATLSNAMDVSEPNNWPRIESLVKQQNWDKQNILRTLSVDDAATKTSMRHLAQNGYVADPHSAIAYTGLQNRLKDNEQGIFLCTAHPAKFKESVDAILECSIELPAEIQAVANKPILSEIIPADYSALRTILDKLA